MIVPELDDKLRTVLERRSDVRFALLFGSSVRDADLARDVDVAISFTRSPSLMVVGVLASELETAVGKSVDVVDVDEANTLVRWEVVRSGRVIVAANMDALLDFKALVPLEYADLKPYLDREAEGLRRALGVR